MTNYEKDIAICEAASDWSGDDIKKLALGEVTYFQTRTQKDAEFIKHFSKPYVRGLLEAKKERDELREALRNLVTAVSEADDAGDWHGDDWCIPYSHAYIYDESLSKAKELLKDE